MGTCCTQSNISQEDILNLSTTKYDYVIIGGGTSAGYACKQFVDSGISSSNTLCMISSESVLPYERPALSKEYLLTKQCELPVFNTCAFIKQVNEEKYYESNNIKVELSTTVNKIDYMNKLITTNNSDRIQYNKLLLATGCSAVKFSNSLSDDKCKFNHIYYLRNIEDGKQIKQILYDNKEEHKDKECVIVGGGYIGMEVTAAIIAVSSFKKITMIFPEQHMMAARGLFTKEMGSKYHQLYQQNGVKFICNSKDILVDSFEGDENGNVQCIKLKNGETISAQVVIVGIGARPNINLFKDTLEIHESSKGLTVNQDLQSITDGDVYGCGDMISFHNKHLNRTVRLEHVRHARSSAIYAIKAMTNTLNEEEQKNGYEFLPVFYSRIFGQNWIFYGDIGAAINADLSFMEQTKYEIKMYCKDIEVDDQQKTDPIKDRQFKLCAMWIDKQTADVVGIFIDSDDENERSYAEKAIKNKKNIKDFDDFIKGFM